MASDFYFGKGTCAICLGKADAGVTRWVENILTEDERLLPGSRHTVHRLCWRGLIDAQRNAARDFRDSPVLSESTKPR